MSYCNKCGFYLDSSHCTMCYRVRDDALIQKSGRGYFDKWWAIIISAPFLIALCYAVTVIEGVVPSFVYTATLLLYTIAIIFDQRNVHAKAKGWTPKTYVWVALALVNPFVGGLLTFAITPYYAYKRRNVRKLD